MRLRWTRERIVETTRQMAAEGRPIYRNAVKQEYPGLVAAAWMKFRYWRNVLVAAGIDPALGKSPMLFWTAERVLKAILTREMRGQPIFFAAVRHQHGGLAVAACKHFGNWSSALRAAGIDPHTVTLRRKWTSAKIISAIRARHEKGLPVNSSAMEKAFPCLVQAGARCMGNWAKALDAAGVPHGPYWTRDRIIAVIRQTRADGGRINHGAFGKKPILGAARRLFGSWDEALEAAGFDPAEIRLARCWTRSAVLAALRRKHSAREHLNITWVRPRGMRDAAIRFFGSWDRALQAAGIDPDSVRQHRRTWTRRVVVDTILRRVRVGQPVNSRHMAPGSIHRAAKRLFRSWDGALRAAGLDPAEIRYPNFRPYRLAGQGEQRAQE